MKSAQNAIISSELVTIAQKAKLSLDNGYQWLPAIRFTAVFHPTVEVELPLFITGINGAKEGRRIAQTLSNAYPAEHPITVYQEGNYQEDSHRDGEERVTALTVPLSQLKSSGVVECLALGKAAVQPITFCVPPLAEGSSFAALQAIVAHLRSPVGCPWDREQTLRTMRRDLLGECAEVLEAIDQETDGSDNSEHIAEELGDLFMAGVLILQIAIDEGRFLLADAMQSIVTKLIRRHPHVFGEVEVDGVDAIWANWDAIKAQEKAAKGQIVQHPLDGVPAELPALEKARELQSKAQKSKLLDRAELAAHWQRIQAKFQAECQEHTLSESTLGQLLWTVVAVAQQADLNAEDALRTYAVRYKAQALTASGE